MKFTTQSVSIPVLSFFNKPITNTLPSKEVTLLEVYELIKGEHYSGNTKKLRKIQDANQAKSFKARCFDYVTFSGTFSKRSEDSIIRHSGLLVLDFDHVNNVDDLKSLLLNDSQLETELLFISPSGNGIKWVVPADISQVNHRDYFKAVENYIQVNYQIKVDQSGKDCCRACFLAHDQNAFINPKYLLL